MPYFDRFDICQAYYLFAYGYHHGGDTSDWIFNRLHRLRYIPNVFLGCSDQPNMGLSTRNAADIYNNLIMYHSDAGGVEPDIINWEE